MYRNGRRSYSAKPGYKPPVKRSRVKRGTEPRVKFRRGAGRVSTRPRKREAPKAMHKGSYLPRRRKRRKRKHRKRK